MQPMSITDDTHSAQEGADQQFLTFYLQDEMFGLNIKPIKEISEYGKITSVPMVPDYVRGVVNLRGKVVPVIDLPVRFGWAKSPVGKRSCIVIVEVALAGRAREVGIVIDSVSEVLDVPQEDIGLSPQFGTNIRSDFISGMLKMDDAFIVLLDMDNIFSAQELSHLDQVSTCA